MKFEMEKLILLCICLNCIVVHGFGEGEERNSDENSVMLELIHRFDPRIASNEIKNCDEERFKKLIPLDIKRYEEIGRRFRHRAGQSCRRKDNDSEDIVQYFVQVLVGTPGQEFFLGVDMASNMTWLNCIYNSANGGGSWLGGSVGGRKRVFNAHESKTFQKLPCSSKLSNTDRTRFSLATCQSGSDPWSYENESHAKGMFGTDTISFPLTNGRSEKINDAVIGCTTGGGTLTEDAILGLGIGLGTFVDKVASRYGGRFSYYLADPSNNCSSYLAFGDISKYKPELLSRIQCTELLDVHPYFAVHLVNISIGSRNLSLPAETFDLVLDSGSTWSTLPSPVYEQVMNELKEFLGGKYKEIGPIPPFEYCFNATGFDVNSLPHIVLYLKGGARFEPPLKDYIVDVIPQVKCIGLFRATTDWAGPIVMGRMMQAKHIWVIDLVNNILGFVKSNCS